MKRFYFIIFIYLLILQGCKCISDDTSITQAMQNFPSGLNPDKNFGPVEVQIYSQIYETLVAFDRTSEEIIPLIAEKWTIDKNNEKFKFKIRKNIHFHNGEMANALEVKSSFDRQLKLKGDLPLLNMVNSVDLIDSSTIEINLKYPYSTFLYNLTSPLSLVIKLEDSIQTDKKTISHLPNGTGPFKLSEWKKNNSIELDRFDDYWESPSSIDHIIFKYIQDRSKREGSILNNQADILNGVTGFSLDRLKWLGKVDYQVLPPISTLFIGFNNKHFPFNNPKVRKALLKAINIDRLVLNVLRGNSIVARNPLPPIFHRTNTFAQSKFNLKEAKELLRASGFEKGLQVKFYYPKRAFSRNTIFELLESALAKIGVSLVFKGFNTWEEHNKACKSDSSQMFISGWRSEVLGEPENFLHSLFYSQSEYNILHYENPDVDLWLKQVRRQPSQKEREKLYQKIVRTILDDTPAIFLYHVKPHFAYNKEKIKYLPVNPYGIIQYHQIILNN